MWIVDSQWYLGVVSILYTDGKVDQEQGWAAAFAYYLYLTNIFCLISNEHVQKYMNIDIFWGVLLNLI